MDRGDWDERYREREFQWTTDPNRFLVECVEGLAPGTAFDLACGEGRNAVWLAGTGWRVTAVDWSEVALERGRRLAAGRGVEVDFVAADLETWVPADAADLVCIVYLQTPGPLRRAVWRRAAAAVARNGRLVVIGHDSSNLTEGYGGPQDPAVLYTADEVTAVVGDTLRVTRADRVQRPVESEDGMRVAFDNIVVAVRGSGDGGDQRAK